MFEHDWRRRVLYLTGKVVRIYPYIPFRATATAPPAWDEVNQRLKVYNNALDIWMILGDARCLSTGRCFICRMVLMPSIAAAEQSSGSALSCKACHHLAIDRKGREKMEYDRTVIKMNRSYEVGINGSGRKAFRLLLS
jgi:hypothetical protein